MHNIAYYFASGEKGQDPSTSAYPTNVYGCAIGFSEFGEDHLNNAPQGLQAQCTTKTGNLSIDLWTFWLTNYCASTILVLLQF